MSAPVRLLLTGFGSPVFLQENPAEHLMRAVEQAGTAPHGAQLKTLVLDADFERCKQQLSEAVREFAPDAVIAWGVDCDRDWVCVERVAINIDYDDTPDNAGRIRNGTRVIDEGPVGYWATLPVEQIAAALMRSGIRAAPSGYAGGHLCNHILYYGLHLAQQMNQPFLMGFIHIPPLPTQLEPDWRVKRGMPLETLVRAAEITTQVVTEFLQLTRQPATHL